MIPLNQRHKLLLLLSLHYGIQGIKYSQAFLTNNHRYNPSISTKPFLSSFPSFRRRTTTCTTSRTTTRSISRIISRASTLNENPQTTTKTTKTSKSTTSPPLDNVSTIKPPKSPKIINNYNAISDIPHPLSESNKENNTIDTSSNQATFQKKKKSKHSSKWLEWIGHKCHETPIGYLPANVIKDFPPIMNIYAKRRSKDGAENAERLLKRLLEEAYAGNPAINGLYTSNHNDNHNSSHTNNSVLTSTVFNVAIDAWAKSGVEEAGERAECIFSLMDKIQKEGRFPSVIRDTISFTSVIDAWANSNIKGSAQRACAILNLMEQLSSETTINNNTTTTTTTTTQTITTSPPRPNRVTYNVCLAALARDRHDRNSALKAEELIERMEQKYQEELQNGERHHHHPNLIKPDVISYQSLIFAWSNCREWGAAQRAEEVLKYMDDLHKTHNDESVKPNVYCFTAAINAWSKSVEQDKVERAWNILQYMQTLYDEGDIDQGPNVYTYTSVMNSACYPCTQGTQEQVENAKTQAFQVALQTMNQMMNSTNIRPNHVAYGTFLNACHRLLPPSAERQALVQKYFLHAVEDGQVGRVVLNKLLLVTTPEEFRNLLRLGYTYNANMSDNNLEDEEDGSKLYHEMNTKLDTNSYNSSIDKIDLECIINHYIPFEWRRNVRGEKAPPADVYTEKARKERYRIPLSKRGAKVWKMRGKSGYYSK